MLISNYKIIGEISKGSISNIYLAENVLNGEFAAIKQIKFFKEFSSDYHNELIQRFYREVRILYSLRHPNIVSTFNSGIANNEPYMIMEYLQGETVALLLEKKKDLHPDFIIKFAIQACKAMAYVHKKNIIHRDIKPENLFYCNNGKLKIIDFNLARINDSLDLTVPGTILGSAVYMPVEQIENPKNIDHRADIYSLGITLYYALSDEFPYFSTTFSEILEEIKNNDPIHLNDVNTRIPPELGEIVMKAIAKRKEDRFSDMNSFRNALLNYYNKREVVKYNSKKVR